MNAKLKMSCAVAAILTGYSTAAAAADMAAAPAATAATAISGVEEVVVTADRRSETVKNVPATIQAFTGDTLTDLNITTLNDILKYTPNVTYGNNGPGQGEIIMRGLSNGFRGSQSSATIGNFPNVAIYLDDQSMQFPARNVDIYMVDMNRVEVLEGPQGTLFGGGAEAGAIRYITNKPELDATSGNVQASYGTTTGGAPNSSANATLNVPIIADKLAVRVVIYDDRQGGYIDNVPSTFTRSNLDLGNYYFGIAPVGGVCPNGKPPGSAGCTIPGGLQYNNYNIAQKDFNPVTHTGARLSALYQINNDWDILVTQSFQNMEADGLSVEYPTGSDFQPLKPLQVTSFNPSYDKDKFENTAWTINGKVWDLNVVYTGGYTVRNISQQMDYTNYSRTGGGMYYQCVGGSTGWGAGAPSCYSPLGYWQDTVRSTHQSHELRVSSPDDWQLRFIAGAYYEDFQIDDVMNFDYKSIPSCTPGNLTAALGGGPVCVADVHPFPGSTTNDPSVRGDTTAFGEDTQRGYKQTAAFASVDYDIIPQTLTVTAGTRWYQYQEFEVGSQYGTNTSCLNVSNGQCASGMVNINAANDKATYTGFKSRANISWHVTPDTMLYYTWSQGFRPGAFNRSVSDVAPGPGGLDQFQKPNGYAPDSLVNNEAGVKTTLFDNHLQLNLSAYYMRWSDVQFLFFNPTELGNTTFGVNGPNYDVKGVEAQFDALITDGLTVQGSGSYNKDTQASSPCLIDNIAGTPAFNSCITQIIPKGAVTPVPFANPFGALGTTPAFSPKFQGNIRARYDWMMDGYDAFVSAGASYMGSQYNQPATYASGTGVVIPNTTFLRYLQPAYTTYDAAIGVSMNQWTAQIFGENLGNSHASTFTSSAQFIKSEVPLRPRTMGLTIGYKF